MISLGLYPDGWEKSWREGVTPWDLGQPTPILLHLLQMGSLPKGRALVPGCGSVCSLSPFHIYVKLRITHMLVRNGFF